MFNPVPKPTPREKTPHRMKRTPIKQGKGNPFPQSSKNQIYKLQGGICSHPGCQREIEEYHHRKKKGMGSSFVWWIHDYRNGSGLCWEHHKWTEEKVYWLLYHEVAGVLKYGWWAGEEITLDEWLDRNELRLRRANIDVKKLVKEVRDSICCT